MGGQEQGRDTICKHANNPNGHNPECGCGWYQAERASQTAPYLAHPFDDCTDDCFECVKQAQWWQIEAMFKAESRAQ